MHLVFMPYGKRNKVETLYQEMECQKYMMPIWKDDKKEEKKLIVGGAIRHLPFGVVEYIFPREFLGNVVMTLTQAKIDRYDIGWIKLGILRKALRLKKIPEFDRTKTQIFPWEREHVNCILLGIREDKDLIDRDGKVINDVTHELSTGWTHEAL